MEMKGWITMMGWVVLCSTSGATVSDDKHSGKAARCLKKTKHLGKGKSNSRRTFLHAALGGKGNVNPVDLSPLYSALKDEADRDFARDKGKDHRDLLRLLWRYFYGISDDEYSDEESSEEKDSKQQEEDSDGEDWRSDEYSTEQCGAKLFPIARKLKARFTPEELYQMGIDLERLLEIELLLILPKCRELTPDEIALLNRAVLALDRSPERLILSYDSRTSETPE
jgi:hypothetical protein